MTQKKKTGISRLLEFGGRYRWMTVVPGRFGTDEQ